MNDFEAYKSLAKTLEGYRFQNLKLLEQLAASISHVQTPELIKGVRLASVDLSGIVNIQSKFQELSWAINSPIAKLSQSANLSIARMLERMQSTREIADLMTVASQDFHQQFQSRVDVLAQGLGEAFLSSQLAKVSKIALLAQASLSRAPWDEVGKMLEIPEQLRTTLCNCFLDFSKSYSSLFRSFENSPLGLFSSHPFAFRLPSVEFFNGADLLELVTIRDEEAELVDEKQRIRNDILIDTEDALQRRVSEIDSNLIELWQGAKQALKSNNPDRVRHFIVSLRELFTQILHHLAPDNEVRKWSSLPEHFSNGCPTRRARLRFICRNIDHDSFCSFIDADVAAALEFTKLFEKGTHKVDSSFTPEQLSAIKIRAESSILFLLEISKFSS